MPTDKVSRSYNLQYIRPQDEIQDAYDAYLQQQIDESAQCRLLFGAHGPGTDGGSQVEMSPGCFVPIVVMQ